MRVVWAGLLLTLYFCPVILSTAPASTPSIDTCDAESGDCPVIPSTASTPSVDTCDAESGDCPGPCQSNPCVEEPKLRCVEVGNSNYECRCPVDTIGEKCEPDPCKLNPCQEPTTRCVLDGEKNYKCRCPLNKIGENCESPGPCTTTVPCSNGAGDCIQVDDIGSYKCECHDDYIGPDCQFRDPCKHNPCNQGKCIADNKTGSFTCDCANTNNIGPKCEYPDECHSTPCQHDGLCTTDSVGKYQCICQDGFQGTNCETPVTECTNKPCNKGTCKKGDNKVECSCGKKFVGEYCETKVTCANHPCEHNGKCIDVSDTYMCVCEAGYSGDDCEIIELPCDQDIATDSEDDVPPVKHPPISKPFCPVLSTIGERAGCEKCYAGIENCKKCCQKTNVSCQANCVLIDKFPSEASSVDKCKQKCTDQDLHCEANCDPNGAPSITPTCPKIFNCPSATVPGAQCRALKNSSGNIECVYKLVEIEKTEYHSYIMFPRINFAGTVQIDSATLNNEYRNFDIDSFAPSDTRITNENWNPSGSSEFRLVNVSVTRVCQGPDLCAYLSHDDPLAEAPVLDQANGKVAAKIVDLDVEVQGRVSEIYGLSIDVGGFFKGDMERASFQSLWYKMIDEPNDDYGEGSRLQSVLKNVQFSKKRMDSPIVRQFERMIGPNQKLSICFNIDLMGEHPASNYSYARIVGSIGLAGENAPHYFDYGRLLRRLPSAVQLNSAPFIIVENNQKNEKEIYIDLGNALAIDRTGNVLISVGQLALGLYENPQGVDTPNCLEKILWISRIYYNENGGYRFTAGITAIDHLSHLDLDKQFVLAKVDEHGECQKILLAEQKDGINVRSKSHFVFRAQHGEVIQGSLFVTVFGKQPQEADHSKINLKLANASSVVMPDRPMGPSQPFEIVQSDDNNSTYNYYFYAKNMIGNIRKIIDGQVYALQYTFKDYPLNPDRNEAMNSAIFIHVYDDVISSPQPTWLADILPIFQVYANLFPVMRDFLDLANYQSVLEKKCHIITSMSLDFQDPQFMPVTRDLSPGKTKMILKWLDTDKPEFGLTHEEKLTKQHLLDMLQTALQLEHSTLPIYLNGFLSIKPFQNQEVKKMIHQIIVDEMFHFAQVANIINGLGGRPYLLGKTFVPSFPSHLPGGCRPNMIASINKISNQQIHDVYMEIEEPSYVLKEHELVALINKISKASLQPTGETSTPGEYTINCAESLAFFPIPNHKITEKNHDTIGDLYMTVVYILGQLTICGQKDIFTGTTRQLKWSDPNHVREVRNYTDALAAIKAIVDQGEGASAYNPLQQNVDSSELSHYYKFSSIFHGRQITTFNVTNEKVYNNNKEECHENYAYLGDKISFFESGVWPVVNDPKMSKYKPGSQAYKNAQAYNDMYRRLLETMQSVFDGNIDRFDDTFGLMKSLMVYGTRVVQTPIDEDGDPNIGPNAGPTYFN